MDQDAATRGERNGISGRLRDGGTRPGRGLGGLGTGDAGLGRSPTGTMRRIGS